MRIFLQGSFVCLQVGTPTSEAAADGNTSGYHLGLDNIAQRLSVLYGSEAKVDIESQGNYHTVVLRCPREEAQ